LIAILMLRRIAVPQSFENRDVHGIEKALRRDNLVKTYIGFVNAGPLPFTTLRFCLRAQCRIPVVIEVSVPLHFALRQMPASMAGLGTFASPLLVGMPRNTRRRRTRP
jgi:hypothetical protein